MRLTNSLSVGIEQIQSARECISAEGRGPSVKKSSFAMYGISSSLDSYFWLIQCVFEKERAFLTVRPSSCIRNVRLTWLAVYFDSERKLYVPWRSRSNSTCSCHSHRHLSHDVSSMKTALRRSTLTTNSIQFSRIVVVISHRLSTLKWPS